jgi:hypothetical protein
MASPIFTPPTPANPWPFTAQPNGLTLAQYLAAGNFCQCSPTIPPAQCPIHAYQTTGINDPIVPGPSVVASLAAQAAAAPVPLISDVRGLRVRHFPWIVPLALIPLAAWLVHHMHWMHL